jgi:Uncharacterised nucleotidyltransferase
MGRRGFWCENSPRSTGCWDLWPAISSGRIGERLPIPILDRARAWRHGQLLQMLVQRNAARRVAEALSRHDIRFVIFKGMALVDQVYGDLSLRAFRDCDILVDRDRPRRHMRSLSASAIRSPTARVCKTAWSRKNPVPICGIAMVSRLICTGPFAVTKCPQSTRSSYGAIVGRRSPRRICRVGGCRQN